MEWTPEKAVETDAKVRIELRTSRASLIRFVAEGAWRLLPKNYATAAAYVQDAAGVKRSEAYRLVATSRAAQMILGRFIQKGDEELDIKPYRWIVNDVIKSSHTGEYLCSVISELTTDIETRLGENGDVYESIAAGVAAHQKPNTAESNNLPPSSSPAEETSSRPARERSDTDSEGGSYPRSDGDFGGPIRDAKSVERGERLIVCPHCNMPLK